MAELPITCYDMSESDVKSVLNIYEKLKNNYDVHFDNDFISDIKLFTVFEVDKIQSGPSICIKSKSPFRLAFIEVTYDFHVGKYSTSDRTEFQI